MCGIAGVLLDDPRSLVDAHLLRAMGDALAHRGPDGAGELIEPGIGLVHRRLAIIDLETGSQPIGNEDGSVQVVFNGEIYNFRELRAWLETRGHRFRTATDTEVIVHLYEESGARLVERLRGMFAFALWDRKRRALLLARDRVGIKPLYVARVNHALLFASELNALLASSDVDRRLDPRALEDYLAYGVVTGARTIFQSVSKLPAAHVLEASGGQLDAQPRRYWQLAFDADEKPSEAEWEEAIRAKVSEAVRLQLVADVPIGAFLSGGVDSSIVAAAAAETLPSPLQTFSVGFAERKYDELPWARQMASRIGAVHRETVVTPDAVSLLDHLVARLGEPIGDSALLPTYVMAQYAREHVKVILSGDGGDEAFGGYSRYVSELAEDRIRKTLPLWARRGLGPIAAGWPKADWLPRPLRAKTRMTNLSLAPAAAYANSLAICRNPSRRELLAPDFAASLNGYDPGLIFESAYARGGDDRLACMLAADTDVLLPDDYLAKVDRASMAFGLEVRPPLLDHELLELAARVPSRLKLRDGQGKLVLKNAFRAKVPASILDRPKQGFDLPLDRWLRGPLRDCFESRVLSGSGPLHSLINISRANRLFRSHRRGTGSHGAVLWSLLVLASWAERHLGARC